MDHPMQPIVFVDPEHPNSASFKPNAIVSFLLKFARGKGVGLNELGDMPWSQEDWDQFYQLIGMTCPATVVAAWSPTRPRTRPRRRPRTPKPSEGH